MRTCVDLVGGGPLIVLVLISSSFEYYYYYYYYYYYFTIREAPQQVSGAIASWTVLPTTKMASSMMAKCLINYWIVGCCSPPPFSI